VSAPRAGVVDVVIEMKYAKIRKNTNEWRVVE
jgi:hypothetical protein